MPPTKRGIFHNLRESRFTISNGEIVTFFSSRLYRDKFLSEYKENRKKFKYTRIESENKVNLSTLADISLYKQIEKRGFRVTVRLIELSWEELHQYALTKMMEKNAPEWVKIPKPKLGDYYGKQTTKKKV